MKILKVLCEFPDAGGNFLCEADEEGCGRCGDALEGCLWIKEVLTTSSDDGLPEAEVSP